MYWAPIALPPVPETQVSETEPAFKPINTETSRTEVLGPVLEFTLSLWAA